MRRYRIATFYVLRAHKSLMDYERGTRYFRQNRPTIEEFEPWRGILESRFRESLEVSADTTSKAVETLASVDPPLAARIDNTIKNILFTFKKDLAALSDSDSETYAKLIYNQDQLVEMTLADFKAVALSLAARSGFRQKRNTLRWFSERESGTKDFMDTMREQQGLLGKVVAGETSVRTVYIFGAGASKHVGYPLISEMGREMLEWMRAYPNGYFRSAAEIVAERFGKTPNIEDVITYLESTIRSLTNSEVPEEKSQRIRLGTVRGHFLEAMREWFREIHVHPAPAYAKFADDVIRSDDTVITFNYDDSLERELTRAGKWDVSRGYGFALGTGEKSSSVLVVKPHGSINWLASLFGGRTSGAAQVDAGMTIGHQPVIHKADLEFLGYKDFEGHVYPGGGALVSLILPGHIKEFFYRTSLGDEWKFFFDSLWAQAETSLKHADKLVICGYSMLPVDKRACDMILTGPRKNIEVEIICGSQGQRIESDFRRAGYAHVSFDASGRFERWVEK